MRLSAPSPRPALTAALTAALLVAGLAPATPAQSFRYALQRTGQVVVDTTLIDKLPKGTTTNPWWDLVVIGEDRWALRRDGMITKNGEEIIPRDPISGPVWVDLEVDIVEGEPIVYSLRADGLLRVEDQVPVIYPTCPDDNDTCVDGEGGFAFQGLAVYDATAYAVRSDGKLYRGANVEPEYDFGELSTEQPFAWLDVAVNPVTEVAYVLRSDGHVWRAEGSKDDGILDDVLPTPGSATPAFVPPLSQAAAFSTELTGVIYHQLLFDAKGGWYALRGNGQVFSDTNTLLAQVDFADDGLFVSSGSQLFFSMDIDAVTGEIWGLRWDGRVYRESDPEDHFFDYKKSGYRRMALGYVGPDVSNVVNSRPAITRYRATGFQGTPVTVPVVVTDVDKLPEDQLITVVSELAPDTTWDPEARTITVDGSTLGARKIVLEVDDGEAKKPRKAKFSIRIKPADVVAETNKKPVVAKLKGGQALVGNPFPITVVAHDPDGDALTITPDTTSGPFAIEGADLDWDADTATLTWTPTIADLGKHQVRFDVSDSQVTRKARVKFTVVNALVLPEEPVDPKDPKDPKGGDGEG